MPEIKREVRAVKVQYACDVCSQGPNPGCLLESTGLIVMTQPPSYEYKCPNCKMTTSCAKSYPVIEYEEIEELSW